MTCFTPCMVQLCPGLCSGFGFGVSVTSGGHCQLGRGPQVLFLRLE